MIFQKLFYSLDIIKLFVFFNWTPFQGHGRIKLPFHFLVIRVGNSVFYSQLCLLIIPVIFRPKTIFLDSCMLILIYVRVWGRIIVCILRTMLFSFAKVIFFSIIMVTYTSLVRISHEHWVICLPFDWSATPWNNIS
jgi:hypothetical protein